MRGRAPNPADSLVAVISAGPGRVEMRPPARVPGQPTNLHPINPVICAGSEAAGRAGPRAQLQPSAPVATGKEAMLPLPLPLGAQARRSGWGSAQGRPRGAGVPGGVSPLQPLCPPSCWPCLCEPKPEAAGCRRRNPVGARATSWELEPEPRYWGVKPGPPTTRSGDSWHLHAPGLPGDLAETGDQGLPHRLSQHNPHNALGNRDQGLRLRRSGPLPSSGPLFWGNRGASGCCR